jgi:hypothetical protein
VVLLALAASAAADEGMWTLDRPPVQLLRQRYGFDPTPEWIGALRAAAVRVGGGSGSFVSGDGLVLTNHHVALGCIENLSTAERDLVRDGFVAQRRTDERACPGLEVRRLESTADVSAAIRGAVTATDEEQANAQRNSAIANAERACAADTRLRCEVITLYRGGAYHLYRYRVWTDVRLVAAPESRIGFFGGDPDNFVYPRYDLDFALLRVYEADRPLATPGHLRLARAPLAEGDLVFAAGHPYSTDREMTLAQVLLERDVRYPFMLAYAKRHRALLAAYGARSAESKRRAEDRLFGTENWLKGMIGEYKALQDPALERRKRDEETALRATASATDPWARIETAVGRERQIFRESWFTAYGYRTVFAMAGEIVAIARERALPDGERLSAYRDSAIPRLTQRLTAEVPVYKDLDTVRIADDWEQARTVLGADHAFVRAVLGARAPAEAAAALVEATRLDNAEERRRLIEGGAVAVDASTDPMIVLARTVYPLYRRLARIEEIEIQTPIERAADTIAQLRFARLAGETYPDATGTLRLSFGAVRGYDADGALTPWHTNFYGLFARSAAFANTAPFELPPRWRERARDLELATPLNFVATLDIIGGNSGSPVVNRAGELVGLVFDGNLDSLAWRFGYGVPNARAVAVNAGAIVEALRKVYDAPGLAGELGTR